EPLRPQEEVLVESLARFGGDSGRFLLGEVLNPWVAFNQGISFLGSPGCGKTVLINAIMRSILPLVGLGQGFWSFIWSYKGDMMQYLDGLDLPVRPESLNPLDERGVGIDISSEVDTEPEATQFVTDLFAAFASGHEGESAGFRRGAEAAATHVVRYFQKAAP